MAAASSLRVTVTPSSLGQVEGEWAQMTSVIGPEECRNCRFWHAGSSICRRQAPMPNMRLPDTSFWPPTKPSDWCGDYERS